MARKTARPPRSRPRGAKKRLTVVRRRPPIKTTKRHSPKRPTIQDSIAPAPTVTTRAHDAALEPGNARWVAYDEIVHKVESTFDVRIDEIHRRLDAQGLRGHRFGDLLQAVITLTGLPAFYAGMVVRSYPGYETDDRDATSLRDFLRARRKP